MKRRWWVAGAMLSALLFLVGCDLDREIEKLLGNLAQVFWEVGFERANDPLLTELTETTGRRVAEVSPRKDMPVKFQVLDVGEVNAFALPNGRIYVFRGLLESADTEDEAAAVLAHEVGHIAGRHSLKQFRLSLGLGLLADLLNLNRQGATVQTLAGLAGTLYELGYSRQHERDADTYAFRLSLLAGYDPQGAVALFEKFVKLEGRPSRLLSYLSTHPPSKERLERAKRVSSDLGRIYPDLPPFAAHTLIGAGYAQRGLYWQAIHHYRAAVQAQPRHVPALIGLAQAKEALGEKEEAKQWYERVLDIEPNNAAAQQGLERLQQQTSSLPPPAGGRTSEPSVTPLWFDQAMEEWALVQQRWQSEWKTTLSTTNSAVGQAKTLWSQLSTLPFQKIQLGRISISYNQSRDRRRQDSLPTPSWHETNRRYELQRKQEELATTCARLLTLFQLTTSEWESLMEDARQAILVWQRSLHDWRTLTEQGYAFPLSFAQAADNSNRILFRFVLSTERERESLREAERQLGRAVMMLAESLNTLLRAEASLWSAEARLQWANDAAQRARAELQALLSRLKEKRGQVDKALISAYHTRLAALELKTPLPVALKIVAYHLRVTEEQAKAVREKVPDIGATAIALAFSKVRKVPPEQLLTEVDFRSDWQEKLLANRVPSGVRVALRWMTNAWERGQAMQDEKEPPTQEHKEDDK